MNAVGPSFRILLLPCLAALSCATPPVPFRAPPPEFTEQDLREELVIFASRFADELDRASERIRSQTREPQILRKTLLWRMHLAPAIQEAASVPDPQEAYVSVSYASALHRRFFTAGNGREAFGPFTPIAVEAAIRLEEECFAIAANFLDEQQMQRLRREVEEFIAKRSISGSDFSVPALRRTAREAKESATFAWVVDLPMSPFRALQGVGSGASAMHQFNDTALRFTLVTEGIPEQLRWQAELLLYDIESRRPVEETLEAIRSFAESTGRLVESVEAVPDDLMRVLSEAEGPMLEANRTLLRVGELMEPLRETAGQIELAGASWARLIQGDSEASPSDEGRPFDIREYDATARSIGEAAGELQKLVSDLGEVLASPGLESALAQVDGSVALAETGGRRVVDHAAWRGFQLLLLFFGLLLLYRLVTARWLKAS